MAILSNHRERFGQNNVEAEFSLPPLYEPWGDRYFILVAIVFPWWSNVLVRWNYGKAKVSLFGFDVHHGGVSRFVSFEADEGQIVVVEILNKTYQVYIGELPINNLNPHRLVLLQVRVSPETTLPDVLVNVEGEKEQMMLINTGTGFAWAK